MNADGESGPQPDTTDQLELLQALVVRFAIHPYPGQHELLDDVSVVVGEIPPDLPFALRIPNGGRVLGGVVSALQGTTVIYLIDRPPEDVLAYYRERLAPEGWQEPEHTLPRGGFVPDNTAMGHRATFCRSEDGPALLVVAISEGSGRSGVRLIIPGDRGPYRNVCRQRPGNVQDLAQTILPPIVGPPNMRQMGGGGSSGGGRLTSTADLLGDIDLEHLAAHYTPQIEQAGWTPVGSGIAAPFAWSTWTLEHDGPWRGLFYALKRPDQPQHIVLSISAEWAGDPAAQPW